MFFKFKWFSERQNRWYTNTYRRFELVEQRLQNLEQLNIKQIIWIRAELGE